MKSKTQAMKTFLALTILLLRGVCSAQSFVGDYVAIIEPKCAEMQKRQVATFSFAPDGWGTGEVLDFQGNHLAWVRGKIEGNKFSAVSVTEQGGWDFTSEFSVTGSINLKKGIVKAKARTPLPIGSCISTVHGWREAR